MLFETMFSSSTPYCDLGNLEEREAATLKEGHAKHLEGYGGIKSL